MDSHKQVAIEAAKEAGNILLRLSKETVSYRMKNRLDIQAEGDLISEKYIIGRIKQSFPHHSILSEEKGEEIHNADYLWVIDPLDGTINFSRNIEEYAVSIALCKNKEVKLGVIYQPVTDNLYIAEEGKGSYLNGKKIVVSSQRETISALAATDNSSNPEARRDTFRILSHICTKVRHIRIFGSGALHLAKIAEGKLDFYYKTRFNFWDYAAGVILLQESGGRVTDFSGKPVTIQSKNIIASNGVIHAASLRLITQR